MFSSFFGGGGGGEYKFTCRHSSTTNETKQKRLTGTFGLNLATSRARCPFLVTTTISFASVQNRHSPRHTFWRSARTTTPTGHAGRARRRSVENCPGAQQDSPRISSSSNPLQKWPELEKTRIGSYSSRQYSSSRKTSCTINRPLPI